VSVEEGGASTGIRFVYVGSLYQTTTNRDVVDLLGAVFVSRDFELSSDNCVLIRAHDDVGRGVAVCSNSPVKEAG
jgi:hypothetical protein